MRENVEKALQKIRPALQADGGDIELIDVVDGVRLTLRWNDYGETLGWSFHFSLFFPARRVVCIPNSIKRPAAAVAIALKFVRAKYING